ncbi:unnamed protein product [Angiostrongylus costaricensis]|uniref:Uncharacterized protein n=1 Tax=Angiostrongylus costaricensis TaxID=334426 RepID=A0A158PJQ7_ANGCS|nr:unnamed protein product [Angiostrongylus costaricensis]
MPGNEVISEMVNKMKEIGDCLDKLLKQQKAEFSATNVPLAPFDTLDMQLLLGEAEVPPSRNPFDEVEKSGCAAREQEDLLLFEADVMLQEYDHLKSFQRKLKNKPNNEKEGCTENQEETYSTNDDRVEIPVKDAQDESCECPDKIKLDGWEAVGGESVKKNDGKTELGGEFSKTNVASYYQDEPSKKIEGFTVRRPNEFCEGSNVVWRNECFHPSSAQHERSTRGEHNDDEEEKRASDGEGARRLSFTNCNSYMRAAVESYAHLSLGEFEKGYHCESRYTSMHGTPSKQRYKLRIKKRMIYCISNFLSFA